MKFGSPNAKIRQPTLMSAASPSQSSGTPRSSDSGCPGSSRYATTPTRSSAPARAGILAARVDHQIERVRPIGPLERRALILGDPLDPNPQRPAGRRDQD